MPLTRSFEQTVQDRVRSDPAYRDALLVEALEVLFQGDVAVGKAILRDYINATIGFEPLARAVGTQPKSLMRMFGPRGNPTTSNLMAVIAELQRSSGIRLRLDVQQLR
ncbi:MAG: transcriptional regulator [Chloroflexota bacterium]|nr:transcriptional regulator [Chloroflexota bacterium]